MPYSPDSYAKTAYSAHALIRMQQRGVSQEAVELILDYACPAPAGNGALTYQFNNETWAEAAQSLGRRAKQFEKYRHAYIIENGCGLVITAAWAH